MNPWLGAKRGYLSDWTTQQWVCRTGRRFELRDEPWLDGPWAPPTGIGARYFEDFATRHGLELGTADGLLPNFAALRSETFDPGAVDPRIAEFYERTGRFRLHLHGRSGAPSTGRSGSSSIASSRAGSASCGCRSRRWTRAGV